MVAWHVIERLGQILADGARRDLHTELEPQFIGNALLAPCQVVTSHLADKSLRCHREGWASRTRCAAPQSSEPLALPSFERFRMHQRQSRSPVKPLRQPDQGQTGGID